MTMEIEQAVPIGTSMLHYLGESAMQIEEGTANTGAETPQTSLAARIDASAPLPCLLISLSNNTNKRGNVKKPPKSSKIILLHGPPGSGKTSLAMNLAYSCAANFNLCRQSCGGTANACRCVAVTIFRHISKEREDFPPFCRKITGSEDQDDDDDAPNDFASRYQKLTDKNDRPNVCDDWETVILRRIQVHYVSSAREILKELLSLLGKPLSQHPCRAIILDDLDLITASTTNYSDPTATATTSTMQTLAIAVDTSRALQRLHGVEPMVLATSIEKIMAPWMDTIVSLKESSQEQPSLQNQLNHSFLRVSSWIAEFTREEEDDSTKGKKHIVEYMVSKSPEGSFEIHWMMPALPSH